MRDVCFSFTSEELLRGTEPPETSRRVSVHSGAHQSSGVDSQRFTVVAIYYPIGLYSIVAFIFLKEIGG
jgi:hypothetical protein